MSGQWDTTVLMQSRMTIGWIEEFVRDGEAVDGFKSC